MSIRALWISDHFLLPIVQHSHNFYQLVYCQEGVGEIGIGDAVHTATAGYAYLIKPHEPHSITPSGDMHAVELKFAVDSEEYDAALQKLPAVFPVDAHAELSLSLREVVREGLSGAFYSHEAASAAVNLFLVRLLRVHRVEAEDRGLQSCYFADSRERRLTPKSRDADFLCVLDYIEHHLSEEITLDDLCSLLGLEKSYLITRFKRTFGTSPMRYVHAMRIEQAKLLLRTTDKSITEIAYEVGFGSIHYFCRFFKQTVGMPPLAFRTACLP